MKNLVTTTELITPAKAAEYLERNKSNRRMNPNTVRYYAKMITNREWKLTSQGISFDCNGNLLDGQHRLSAIISANAAILMRVTRGEDPSNFAVYDTGKTRTAGDVLSVQQVASAKSVAATVRNYLAILNTRTVHGNGYTRASNQEILDTYSLHPDIFSETYRCAQNHNTKMGILKASFVAGMISYLIIDGDYEKSFVYGFFDKLYDLGDSTPQTLRLRELLVRDASTGSTRRYSTVVKQQLLIKTWNAYVEGRTIKCLKWSKETEGFIYPIIKK